MAGRTMPRKELEVLSELTRSEARANGAEIMENEHCRASGLPKVSANSKDGGGAVMTRNVVKAEARRLIEQHGEEAYGKAAASARLAMRSRNSRMTSFLSEVVTEVARQTRLRLLGPRALPRRGTVYLRIADALKVQKPGPK